MSGADAERWRRLAAATAAWLPRARWVAAEVAGGPPRLADACAAGDTALLLVQLGAADASLPYLVPVAADTGADAACGNGFLGWLLDVVRAGRSVAGLHGGFVGHPVGVGPGGGPTVEAASRLTADASNTSCLVRTGGTGLVVKLLRRGRAGIQPEVELGEFFATRSPFAATPRLCGWLEYRPTDGGPGTALATVHDWIPDCRSAWEFLGGLLADGGPGGPHRRRIFAVVAAIGRVTGQMHAALTARTDVAAFAPVSTTPAARAAAAAHLAAHATDVLDMAAARLDTLPKPIRDRLGRVLDRRAAILARLQGLAAALPEQLIRVHGDYHLGQVLVTADGRVFVIDFEGEPGRTLADRRAPAPAAKDLAGMCRSFDYLARHAGQEDAAGLAAELERGFLAAYAAAATDGPWRSADDAASARLLDILKLDKAVYELAYELQYRPDHVAIPLAGIEAALAAC